MRQVKVWRYPDTWFVEFTDRKPYGKWLAGQFYIPTLAPTIEAGLEYIMEWIRKKGYEVTEVDCVPKPKPSRGKHVKRNS